MITVRQTEPPSMAVELEGNLIFRFNEDYQSFGVSSLVLTFNAQLLAISPNASTDGYGRVDSLILSLGGFPYHHVNILAGRSVYPQPIPRSLDESDILLAFIRVPFLATHITNADIEVIPQASLNQF